MASTRCCAVVSGCLASFTPTATTTLSKSCSARRTTEACPMVNGSNVPANSPVFIISHAKIDNYLQENGFFAFFNKKNNTKQPTIRQLLLLL